MPSRTNWGCALRVIDEMKPFGGTQVLTIGLCLLLMFFAWPVSPTQAADEPHCGRTWVWVSQANGDRSRVIRLKVKCRFAGDSLSDLTVTRLTPAGRSGGKRARVLSIGEPQVKGPGKRRLDLFCDVTTHRFMLRPRSFNGVACSIRGYRPLTLSLRIRVPKRTACKYKVRVRSRNATFGDDGMWPVGVRSEGGRAGVRQGSSRASLNDVLLFNRPRNCGRQDRVRP